MKADVLRQWDGGSSGPTAAGVWKSKQNPINGEIERVWVSDFDTGMAGTQLFTIDCEARAIITGGVRALGTTEQWGSVYDKVEVITMKFDPSIILSERDRITNIRNSEGVVIWKEEAISGTSFPPTIFDIKGVSPIMDPFGHLSEFMAVLERADIQ